MDYRRNETVRRQPLDSCPTTFGLVPDNLWTCGAQPLDLWGTTFGLLNALPERPERSIQKDTDFQPEPNSVTGVFNPNRSWERMFLHFMPFMSFPARFRSLAGILPVVLSCRSPQCLQHTDNHTSRPSNDTDPESYDRFEVNPAFTLFSKLPSMPLFSGLTGGCGKW